MAAKYRYGMIVMLVLGWATTLALLIVLTGRGQQAEGQPTPLAHSDMGAFPGAEGAGRFAQGGRGGKVIEVTNLNDSGAGSLRACIDETGPRVCIFRVSGVIRFTSTRPVIHNPFLTIAGETAPGGGILLTHGGGDVGLTPLVVKNTHDVVIRHIRVRLDRPGTARNANSTFTIEGSQNVILDHVSGSWSFDEGVGTHAQNDNITISWSIFAEGVPRHDKCALLGSDPKGPQNLSFIHNLCAHNGDRNPDIHFMPGSCAEIINNVMYNAQSEFSEVWENYGGTPVNIVNNYYKAGPNTSKFAPAIVRQTIGTLGQARIYAPGNYFDGRYLALAPTVQVALVDKPLCNFPTKPVSAMRAYDQVLQSSGAFPRDDVDRRVTAEVRSRTGAIVDGPGVLPQLAAGQAYQDDDHDGMSDAWERTHGTDPQTSDPWGDFNNDGWTNLDEFLAYASDQVIAGQIVK